MINPGIVFQNDKDEESNINMDYCKKCKLYIPKSKKAKHCDICQICVEGRDHHCGVIGKCIGRRNIACFYLMLVFTVISMISLYVVIILFFIHLFSK